ncbi:MAG: hypothetical protein H7222_11110 [Methylotenera sp.]|nr:hypothetical protein [Oligoflexia bacterium]
MGAASAYLKKLETEVNTAVDKYVSVANFHIGSNEFGLLGTASLGQLHAPTYDPKHPKNTLHSGVADFGIQPSYLIDALLFGKPLNIVDARMGGGQGPRAEVVCGQSVNRDKTDVTFSVKVIGINVLAKRNKGPEVAAAGPAPECPGSTQAPAAAAQLPAKEKTGAGGPLFNIAHSIGEGGTPPTIPIFTGVYVEFDAGFTLNASLVFSYGVQSPFGNLSGTTGNVFEKKQTPLEANPANATDQYCEASSAPPANGTAPVCAQKSSAVPPKSPHFYDGMVNHVTSYPDRFKLLGEQARAIKIKGFGDDAKKVRDAAKADWAALTDPTKPLDERLGILNQNDLCGSIDKLTCTNKIGAAYQTGMGLVNDLTEDYKKIDAIVTTFSNGMPEVKVSAGLALSGSATGWATATLNVGGGPIKAFAGIRGYLTLIDIKIGAGVALSTKSQYIDLTAKIESIRLAGGLDLFWGVTVSVPGTNLSQTWDGTRNLLSFPGTRNLDEWVIGRLDFRPPTGKPMLFWCVDIFGNTQIDPDRCNSGDINQDDVLPGLALHEELREKFMGLKALHATPACLYSDGGQPFYTSLSTATADCSLPDPGQPLPIDISNHKLHPIALYYNEHPVSFQSSLRDDSNKPIKIFTLDAQGRTVADHKTYVATLPIPAPTPTANRMAFDLPSVVAVGETSPVEDRIFSLSSIAQFVQPRATSGAVALTPAIGDPNDPNLQIKMGWATTYSGSVLPGTTWPVTADSKVYVGDLSALPNLALVDMAKKFRLGRCQVDERDSELYVAVAGVPWPKTGDPQGRVSVNMTSEADACFVGNPAISGAQDAYMACALREAIKKQECFPPERVVELVALANLSDADAVKYFLATQGTPDKKISGDIIATAITPTGTLASPQLGWNGSSSNESDLRGSFFGAPRNSRSSPPLLEQTLLPYYNNGSFSTCDLSDQSSTQLLAPGQALPSTYSRTHGQYYNFFVGFSCSSTYQDPVQCDPDARYLAGIYTRQAYGCMAVGSSAAQSVPVGDQSSQTPCYSKAFVAHYHIGLSNYVEQMCNPADQQHKNNFIATQLVGLKNDARQDTSVSNAKTQELVLGIKNCIVSAKCSYSPDSLSADVVQLAFASTCGMKVTRLPSTTVPNPTPLITPLPAGPADTQSVDDCIQQSGTPNNFKDAQAFCNSPTINQWLKGATTISGAGSAFDLNVDWSSTGRSELQLVADQNATAHQNRFIGRCFTALRYETDDNGNPVPVVDIRGQTDSGVRSPASTTNAPACQLAVRATATGNSFDLTSVLQDDTFGVPTDINSCWRSYGFDPQKSETDTTNLARSNDVCSGLDNVSLYGLFSANAAALTAPCSQGGCITEKRSTLTRHANALVNTTFATSGSTKTTACELAFTPDEWKSRLQQRCSIKLTGSAPALPQEITLDPGTRGCQAAANAFASCAKFKSLPIYIPFSPVGVNFTAKSGSTVLNPPTSCTGPYDPTGYTADDVNLSLDCQLLASPGNSTVTPEYTENLPFLGQTAPSNNSTCHDAWAEKIQPTTAQNFSTASYLKSFCESELASVAGYLEMNRSALMSANTTSNTSTGQISWHTVGTTPPINGAVPVTMSFSSLYTDNTDKNAPVPGTRSAEIAQCGYVFKPGATDHDWYLKSTLSEEIIKKTCVRPVASTDPNNTEDGPDCMVLTPGKLLMGGAGPGFLAQPQTNPTIDPWSSDLQNTCTTFLPKMNPISNLKQPVGNHRLPLWVLTVNAEGNIVEASGMPKDTDPAPMYCDAYVGECRLDANFLGQSESRPVTLGFFADFGLKPTSAQDCHNKHASAADSVCADFRSNSDIPDNIAIELVSSYGTDQVTLKTCEPSENQNACVIGYSRNATTLSLPTEEKPYGGPSVHSQTEHSFPLNIPNTQQNCLDYFSTSGTCTETNSYAVDPSYPGAPYYVNVKFGPDVQVLNTCYTSLILAAVPTADPTNADFGPKFITLNWSDLHPPVGTTYDLQYCRGVNCQPSMQSSPDHFADTFPAYSPHGSHTTTSDIPVSSGATYGFRIRANISGVAPGPNVTLPWSPTVYAAASGIEQPVILSQGTPIIDNEVTLNWTDFKTPSDHYEMQSCEGVGCVNFGPLPVPVQGSGTPPPTNPIFASDVRTTIFPLVNGELTLRFRIRSFSDATTAEVWSPVLEVFTTGGGIGTGGGGSPGNQNVSLSLANSMDNMFSLSWADSGRSDHYELQACSDLVCSQTSPLPQGANDIQGNPQPAVGPIFPGSVTTATFNLINGGQTFYFRMRSFDNATGPGNDWSDVIRVKVTGGQINTLGGGGAGSTSTIALSGPASVVAGSCRGPLILQITSGSISVISRVAQVSKATPSFLSRTMAFLTGSTTIVAPTVVEPVFTLAGQGSGHFYTDNTCLSPISTISTSGGTANFYFKDALSENVILSASNASLTLPATLAVSVTRDGLQQQCLAGDLDACRNYVASFPAGQSQTDAEASIKSLIVSQAPTLCGIFGIRCPEGDFTVKPTFGNIANTGALQFIGDTASHHSTFLNRDVLKVYSTSNAFAALKKDGSVVTWGGPDFGGDSGFVSDQLRSGVKEIYSNERAFAALKSDGTVVTWGWASDGGNAGILQKELTGVKAVFSTQYAFAALKEDHTLVVWGNATYGGEASAVKSKLTEVQTVYSNQMAFAALKSDGTVVTWGWNSSGGDSSEVSDILSGVTSISSTQSAFAALKGDGTVVTWGSDYTGGDSSKVSDSLRNIKSIVSSPNAFAAITNDGNVVTWGVDYYGGDSSAVQSRLSGAIAVYSNLFSFAALKKDGSVVTWGAPALGGDSSAVSSKLTQVSAIYSDDLAYAALRTDGSVVTWGMDVYGGKSEAVADQLTGVVSVSANKTSFAAITKAGSVVTWGAVGGISSEVHTELASGVISIQANQYAFAAVKADGSVVTWGDSGSGGGASKVSPVLSGSVRSVTTSGSAYAALKSDGSVAVWGAPYYGGDASSVQSCLASDVTSVVSTHYAFAALKSKGAVVTWGNSENGGNSSAVTANISSGVTQVFSNDSAFAALKSDGSVVTWGLSTSGGDSSSVASQLSRGVKSISSSNYAFAALKTDGSVVTWGYSGASADVREQLSSGVVKIFSNTYAFAALKSDGTLVTWGGDRYGGDSSSVTSRLQNVVDVRPSNFAFAALTSSGSVVSWGNIYPGGDGAAIEKGLSSNVIALSSTGTAFAALRSDGTVITWGYYDDGGSSSSVSSSLNGIKSIYSTATAFVGMKADGTAVAWGRGCKANTAAHYKNIIASKQSIVVEGSSGEINPICGPSHSGFSSLNTSDYFLITDGQKIYYLK